MIEVEPSDVVRHNRRDEVYLRVGDETRRLSFGQRQELMYDKGQSVFDGTTVPNLTVDDLNWESIHEWANTLDALDPERLMRRRGLLQRMASRPLPFSCSARTPKSITPMPTSAFSDTGALSGGPGAGNSFSAIRPSTAPSTRCSHKLPRQSEIRSRPRGDSPPQGASPTCP